MSILWEVIVSVILSKTVYRYMCHIPNGFRDTAISLQSCKTPNYPKSWAHETVDGVLQHQHWHYHRRSCKRTAHQHIRHLVKMCGILHSTPTVSLTAVTNRQLTLHTVAQYGGSEAQYWVPNPNSCTVQQLQLGNRSE